MNRDITEAPVALAGPLLTIAAELNIPGYQTMSVREIVNAILDEADKVNGIRDGCYKCGTASNLITICEDCNVRYCYQCYIEMTM